MDCLRWLRHPFSVPHEEARTMTPVTFCGRTFAEQEVELMRVMAHDYAGLGVPEIARTVCELPEWKRPNGGLKNHECRQLMERLAADGMLRLPALRKLGGPGRGAWVYPGHAAGLGARPIQHQRIELNRVSAAGR